MKSNLTHYRGFSLVELLVGLSIMAVVAMVVMPRYLDLRRSAADAAAKAQISVMNSVFNQWRALGGKVNFATGTAGASPSGQYASNAELGLALEFLQTTGNGSRNRGILGSPLLDSMSALGSRSVSITPIPVSYSPVPVLPSARDPDGFYNIVGRQRAAGGSYYTFDTPYGPQVLKGAGWYLKVGSHVYLLRLHEHEGFSLHGFGQYDFDTTYSFELPR